MVPTVRIPAALQILILPRKNVDGVPSGRTLIPMTSSITSVCASVRQRASAKSLKEFVGRQKVFGVAGAAGLDRQRGRDTCDNAGKLHFARGPRHCTASFPNPRPPRHSKLLASSTSSSPTTMASRAYARHLIGPPCIQSR